jgi:putative copper export protein
VRTDELMLAVTAYQAPAPWRFLTEIAFFIGLFGALGVTLVHGIVIRPVLRRPTVDPADRAVLERAMSLFLAAMGTFLLVALYLQIAGKAARVKGREIPYADALRPNAVWHYVSVPAKPGEWISTGAQTLVQYAIWAVAAIVMMLLWAPALRTRIGALTWTAFVVAVVGYQVTALPTDFAKETFDGVLDANLTHVHVVSNATWAGGITTLVLLSSLHRRLTAGAGLTWAQLWTRFSKVALTAVGCTLITGSWLAWKFVGAPRELLTTTFGHVLIVKVSLVATMIAIGGVNEFVMMPRIARARAAGEDGSVFRLAVRVFPRLVAAEAALALGVLVAVSFLSGSARAEHGDNPDPIVTGGVLAIGAVMAVLLATCLIATAKMSDRLSRPAVSPAVPAAEPHAVAAAGTAGPSAVPLPAVEPNHRS